MSDSSHISQDRALLVGVSIAAFGVAAYFRKLAVNRIHPFQFETISGMFHLLVGIICLLLASKYVDTPWDTKGFWYTIIQCFINSVGALAFMFALRQANDVGYVTSIVSISPIITLMLSALLLGEQPGIRSMIGIFFVLIGVVIASWR